MRQLTTEEQGVLRRLLGKNGNRTKSRIRHGWETGDYSDLRGLEAFDDSTLQRIRNTLGLSWLSRVSLRKVVR